MKTNNTNEKSSELKSRPEQGSTEKAKFKQGTGNTKPYVNYKEREANRQLPVERVLAVLKRWMPKQYAIAQVVGQWIWIQFAEAPAEHVRGELSQLGFHWNRKRKLWQHPCGKMSAGTKDDPRGKYTNHFPARSQAA